MELNVTEAEPKRLTKEQKDLMDEAIIEAQQRKMRQMKARNG